MPRSSESTAPAVVFFGTGVEWMRVFAVGQCTLGMGKQSASRCFLLADGEVKQYVSSRRNC